MPIARSRSTRTLVMAAALIALSGAGGCVSVLPEPAVPQALLQMPADRAQAPTLPLAVDVNIFPPDAPRAFSGADIAVTSGVEIVFLSDVRWSDAAPRLMQGALVNALSGAGGSGRANPAQLAARATYELRWRIVDLSVGRGADDVRCAVEATLLDAVTRSVVASRALSASRKPAGDSQRARAAALVEAAQAVADQAAQFVAEQAVPVPAPVRPAP